MATPIVRIYIYSLIGIWVLLALAIFGYNLLHYPLYVASPASLFWRFVLPAALAAALVCSVRAGIETRIVVANILAAIMVALYGGEVYLAFRLDWLQRAGAQREGAKVDLRDKLTVIRDLRARGIEAYPIMRGRNMLLPDSRGQLQPVLTSGGQPLLPLASLPEVTVVSCNESGMWQIYKSDRHGFNNPDSEWDVEVPAIGLIGDSFAHGSCVAPEQNIAAHLRRRFGHVINLGVGGNGPLLELATLTEYLEILRPPIVLWAFFEGNDINEDLPFERRAPVLMRYLRDQGFSQDLFRRTHEITTALRAYLDTNLIAAMDRVDDPSENLLRYLSLDRVREAVGVGPVQIGFNSGDLTEELSLFDEVIGVADARTRGWGGHLYLVYLPESDRYLSRFGDSAMRRAIYEGVTAVAIRRGIPLIDIARAFAMDPDPGSLYAYPGAHFSPKGYGRAAEIIADALGKRAQTPSSPAAAITP
jgi:hypothetical protein